jgi:hypothetical protein
MTDQVGAMVGKAQAAGAQGPELEDAKAKAQQIANAYRSEPNKTYISALARMTDLVKNLSMLTTQLALNYVDVKTNLVSADTVNAQKLKVAEDNYGAAKTDLGTEHDNHQKERQTILARIDQFQSENARMATEIQALNTKIRKQEDDANKSRDLAQQTIRDLRDRVERKETILDRPDGRITFVDYRRGEIRTNVSRSTGARPLMRFTIFDANAAGIPTDKPKGSIELITVGDRDSIARVLQTTSTVDPIRVGDIVYSAAWSANEPMRFALIGKIDINRDGRDDREELKRMIQQAGGVIDYDLPPVYVGKETGKISPRIDWFVTDDRIPLREAYRTRSEPLFTEIVKLPQRVGEVIKQARQDGIRPMPIERLLRLLDGR